jgi:hypothetical protein
VITLGAPGLDARKAVEHDVEHPAAAGPSRNTPQLAKELGHFVALEEHAAGVPVLADAPVDLRVVFVVEKSDGLVSTLARTVERTLRAQSDEVLGQFSLDRPDSALKRMLDQVTTQNGHRSAGVHRGEVPRRGDRLALSPRLALF